MISFSKPFSFTKDFTCSLYFLPLPITTSGIFNSDFNNNIALQIFNKFFLSMIDPT